MVRLKVRCRCITVVVVVAQVFLGLWFFCQPLNPPHQFLQRVFREGGQSIVHLKDQPRSHYFATFGKESCIREGTVLEESSEAHCVCRAGWSGKMCGIPRLVKESLWIHQSELTKGLTLRKRARRVVMLVPLTHEYEIFAANVNELRGLVDVFVIGEGSAKTSRSKTSQSQPMLEKLKGGWLEEHQDKFVYVPVPGSVASPNTDSLLQHVVHDGLRLLSDLRPDDLLLFTTGEEVIKRDVLVFLKLFQGYPLPIRCHFKMYLYGFFWKVEEGRNSSSTQNAENQICILSLNFFSNAFGYQVSELSGGDISMESRKFLTTKEQPVQDWTLPEAGWKCHFCVSVQNIFEKFASLSDDVRPWWFDESPSNMQPFIQRLIQFGQDENSNPVGSINRPESDTLPPYFWQHRDQLQHMVMNPYETISIQSVV